MSPSPQRAAGAEPASLAGLAAAWLAPLVAGAALRLWNQHRQILLDDEMHTVATALYTTLGDILSSFKSEDPCLPLTALYRVLLEAGVPFSEMTFRVPVLLASLAVIVVLPKVALPLIGRNAAILLAWLLAVSPVLAIYSGMVRPYGVISLLAPAATLAVLRWRESGGLRWGIAYALVAALCLWFHLGTAPLVAAPFGLLLLESLLRGRWPERVAAPPATSVPGVLPAAPAGAPPGATDAEAPMAIPRLRWRDLGIVAVLTLGLIAAFMVPAWASLRELYAVKSGIAPFSFELVPPIARLQSGTAIGDLAAPLMLLFWAAVARGAALLLRSRSRLALYLIGVILAQWVGLAILAPIGLLNPIIFNRYLIGTLPLVLILAAIGLAAVALRSGRIGRLAVPAVALIALVAAGPFADPVFRSSSFQHSKDFIRFDLPRGRMEESAVPAFYRSDELGESSAPLVELPFRGGWSATRTHYVYQSIHRLPVLAAEPYGWPCDERLRLRNHVCSEPAVMLQGAARFVIVHRDPLAEELLMEGGDDTGNRYNPHEWEEFTRIAGRAARTLRRRWGPPLHRDERILVWDLDAVRSRGPRR